MGYRDYSTAKGHIVATDGSGDFTTIGAALTAASSGQTIFIRPGTYTENITLKAGVDIVAFEANAYADQNGPTTAGVNILGKVTASYSGSATMSGVCLTTNSDFCLSLTASTAVLILIDCFFIANGNTGISMSGNGLIWMYDCGGNIATAATAFMTASTGGLKCYRSVFQNTAGSTTASTFSGPSQIEFHYCNLLFRISNSGTSSGLFGEHTAFSYTGNDASPSVTTNSTAGNISFAWCEFFQEGTGVGLSIGAGATAQLAFCTFSVAGSTAISGSGTLSYNKLIFIGSSSTISGVTQSLLPVSPSESVTQHDVLIGGANGAISSLTNGTTGQVLTASTGADPSWSALPFTQLPWTDESTTFSPAVGNGYFITGNATATLPASPSQGNMISFIVDAAATTVTVTANTGQVIRVGTAVSATAGTAANNARGDALTLIFRSSDSAWIAREVIGTWTVT